MRSPRRVRIALIAAGALAAGFIGQVATAGNGGPTPANKVVAAASKRVVVAPDLNEVLMSATMKTSKPTDLMFQVTLECTILTALKTSNEDNSATASGTVLVWIEVDDQVVSLQSVSEPPQNPTPPGNDSDKVTFCDREYQRTVTDDEDNTPPDGIDIEDDYIRTKSSHAFNWVKMNLGSGIHKIEVVADLTTAVDGDNARAEAIVGNRSLIVEPTKMANDAVIEEAGS